MTSWTRRELAVFLGSRGRIDEALAEANLGVKLEPNNPYSHTTRYHVCKNAGKIEEAKKELHDAISLSVDNGYAMSQLVGICQTIQERRDALAFIKQELIKQVIFGDALLAFREAAYPVLAAEGIARLAE